MNITKFTQKSVEIINNLEKIAYDYDHQEITQEHLLYSMLTTEDSLISRLFEKWRLTRLSFWRRLKDCSTSGQKSRVETSTLVRI